MISLVNTHSRLKQFKKTPFASSRLIIFPGAGSGASAFRNVCMLLPEHIEASVVQLPGREDKISEPFLNSMESVVSELAQQIKPLCDQPIVFFGHSMGALIAYEVALYMKEQYDLQPDILITCSLPAPHAATKSQRCHHTAPKQDMVKDLMRLGGTAKSILEDESFLDVFVQTLRADYKILDQYQPSLPRKLDCKIIACSGKKDAGVSHESLNQWSAYTQGEFESHWFMGGHFFFMKQVKLLCDRLDAWIDSDEIVMDIAS